MQPNLQRKLNELYPGWRDRLRWGGDNREFVVECVLPLMTWLDDDVRQVVRWAYGYDGEAQSLESWSDGSSAVRNRFFDGLAKDPHGVGHDYLHWLSHRDLADPARRSWTFMQAADWYKRASKQFGDGNAIAFWRRVGLDVFAWPLWGPRGLKHGRFKKKAHRRRRV